jgi:class 3 adenylate cyclase
VFCDLVGSTGLGERLDSETVQRLLVRFFEEARRIIQLHGGTVQKFIGDAVVAVFGVPVAHEDDAVRAVRAAVALRDRIAQANPELELSFGARLELRVGVNTGEVVAAQDEWLVTGDAVNVAARLQQEAQPNEIVIGHETLALARNDFLVDSLGPLRLKGKQEPVTAYRLLGVRDPADRTEGIHAPFVGRARELARLENAFAHARRERICSLVTLLGPRGRADDCARSPGRRPPRSRRPAGIRPGRHAGRFDLASPNSQPLA